MEVSTWNKAYKEFSKSVDIFFTKKTTLDMKALSSVINRKALKMTQSIVLHLFELVGWMQSNVNICWHVLSGDIFLDFDVRIRFALF